MPLERDTYAPSATWAMAVKNERTSGKRSTTKVLEQTHLPLHYYPLVHLRSTRETFKGLLLSISISSTTTKESSRAQTRLSTSVLSAHVIPLPMELYIAAPGLLQMSLEKNKGS